MYKRLTTSDRLKEIMRIRDLKQIDIMNLAKPYCKKFDVTLNKSNLSQYVNGQFEPSQNKIFVLAKALNVSEAWLMGFEVPMERTSDPEPQLTKTELLDIGTMIDNVMNNLESSQGLMFEGQPIDDESKELLRASLENTYRMAKLMQKKKEQSE